MFEFFVLSKKTVDCETLIHATPRSTRPKRDLRDEIDDVVFISRKNMMKKKTKRFVFHVNRSENEFSEYCAPLMLLSTVKSNRFFLVYLFFALIFFGLSVIFTA